MDSQPEVIYDVAEPITVYRWWQYTGGYIRSYRQWWKPGEPITAYCWECDFAGDDQENPPVLIKRDFVPTDIEHSDHYAHLVTKPGCPHPHRGSPARGHACGIYGFTNIELAIIEKPTLYTIFGQVELAGTVYQHEHGYRASDARLAGLFFVPPALVCEKWASQRLHGAYRPPSYEEFVALAERYGVPAQRLPKSLLTTMTRAAMEWGAA